MKIDFSLQEKLLTMREKLITISFLNIVIYIVCQAYFSITWIRMTLQHVLFCSCGFEWLTIGYLDLTIR